MVKFSLIESFAKKNNILISNKEELEALTSIRFYDNICKKTLTIVLNDNDNIVDYLTLPFFTSLESFKLHANIVNLPRLENVSTFIREIDIKSTRLKKNGDITFFFLVHLKYFVLLRQLIFFLFLLVSEPSQS